MNLFLRSIVFIILGLAALSSQSEDDQLVIPEVAQGCEGCIISVQKLGQKIANQFTEITRVYNFSFFSLQISDTINQDSGVLVDVWISFTMETVSGDVYNHIQCEFGIFADELFFDDCGNDQVVLDEDIAVDMEDIILVDTRKPDPVDPRRRVH